MILDPKEQSQAVSLINAIHQVRPPVFSIGVNIAKRNNIDTVTVTYLMTPELIGAWGEHCSGNHNTKDKVADSQD